MTGVNPASDTATHDAAGDEGASARGALRRVAFLVAPEGTEEAELTHPWEAVAAAGGRPELISTSPGTARLFQHLDPSRTWPVDRTVESANPADYALLVLPGGVANPDFLRWQPGVAAFVRQVADAGIPIAVICHGPWTLIDAGVLPGRTLTSWPSLQTDLRNAGAQWVDAAVHVDDTRAPTLISSRNPEDLPVFSSAVLTALRKASAA